MWWKKNMIKRSSKYSALPHAVKIEIRSMIRSIIEDVLEKRMQELHVEMQRRRHIMSRKQNLQCPKTLCKCFWWQIVHYHCLCDFPSLRFPLFLDEEALQDHVLLVGWRTYSWTLPGLNFQL